MIPVLKSLEEFANSMNTLDIETYINPLVDGNAQNRVIEYIQVLLDLKEREKSGRMREYNLIYKKKYGNNKVIESEVL